MLCWGAMKEGGPAQNQVILVALIMLPLQIQCAKSRFREGLGKSIGVCQLVESVIRFYVWLSKWWYTISSTKKSVTNYSNNKALDLY